ncbi:MAG: Wzz/FepE/Etk N-terminal domain-containing protein, partial [Terracidiphilus sp.]
MPGHLSIQEAPPEVSGARAATQSAPSASTSLRDLWRVVWRRRRLIAAVEGSLLLACLLYCLIAPNQYEAAARVELRTSPASSLNLDSSEPSAASSILSAPIALETLASVLRSDQLAWQVITGLKLYRAPGFSGSFASRFPGFNPQKPAPDA